MVLKTSQFLWCGCFKSKLIIAVKSSNQLTLDFCSGQAFFLKHLLPPVQNSPSHSQSCRALDLFLLDCFWRTKTVTHCLEKQCNMFMCMFYTVPCQMVCIFQSNDGGIRDYLSLHRCSLGQIWLILWDSVFVVATVTRKRKHLIVKGLG